MYARIAACHPARPASAGRRRSTAVRRSQARIGRPSSKRPWVKSSTYQASWTSHSSTTSTVAPRIRSISASRSAMGATPRDSSSAALSARSSDAVVGGLLDRLRGQRAALVHRGG